MNKYSLLFIAVLSSCVQVAHLNIDGVPENDRPIKYVEEPYVEEGYESEPNLMKNVYSCQKDSLEVSYFSRMIEVKVDNPVGQCFGVWFSPRIISYEAEINFKARYTGTDTLDLVVGFTDALGGKVEALDQEQKLLPGKRFSSLKISFSEVLADSSLSFDMTKVETVIFYLNTENKNNLKGMLTLKELKVN